jgi:hypothetical protein
LSSASAAAGPDETAAQARAAEQELDYDIATDLWMNVIIDESTSESLLLEAHLRSGVLQRIQGNDDAARLHFRFVLTRYSEFDIPQDVTPKVRDFFEIVRSEVKEEQASEPAHPPAADPSQAPPAERPPESPPPVAADPSSAAVVAADDGERGSSPVQLVLFVAGGGLLGVSGLIAGVGALFGTSSAILHEEALTTSVQTERRALMNERDFGATVANVSLLVSAVSAAAGVGLLAGGLLVGE